MTRRIAMMFAAGIILVLTQAAPAWALSFATFVSGNGDDSNTVNLCSHAKPCATFSAALGVTTSGGIIACLDPVESATLFSLTITQDVTIDCSETYGALFVTPGVPGSVPSIVINTPGIRVTLRGLTIYTDTSGNANAASAGIEITSSAIVQVERCKIFGIRTIKGRGINVAPASGTTKLRVLDSVITDNGLASSQGGIVVEPTGTGNARVVIEHTRIANNTHGIVASGLLTTGFIVIQVRDSVVADSLGNGIFAITQSSNGPAGIVIDHTSSVNNAGSGVLAQGAGALVEIGQSTVAGNATGLGATNGGQIFSYQNNQASGNVFDGGPTGTLSLK